MRRSRGSSTTRMRTSRAKPPMAINDAPIERALRRARRRNSTARRSTTSRSWCARSTPTTASGSAAQRARRWRNTPRAMAPTPAMRAEALLQLGLWGKVPQRDRIVGIYPAAGRARWQAGGRCVDRRAAQGVGQGAGSRAARRARRHRQPATARSGSPTLVATVANDQAPEAVRVGALKALDAFGGDDVMRGIDAAEKSSVAGAAPRGAADRGASRARSRAADHQALRPKVRRPNNRRRSRRMGAAQGRRRRPSCWWLRSISSRRARCSRARRSS